MKKIILSFCVAVGLSFGLAAGASASEGGIHWDKGKKSAVIKVQDASDYRLPFRQINAAVCPFPRFQTKTHTHP